MKGLGKVIAGLAAVLLTTPACAGPPYFTDDPVPTDRGQWEIYTFANGTKTPGSFEGAAGFDLNYGPVEDVQLTATLPLDYSHSAGDRHTGFGDVEIGLKYRFFHDEAAGLAFAVFPRVILPTAKARFGSGRTGVLLPLWGQKDIGRWSIFGGGGYSVNPGAGNRDFVQSGLAVTRIVSNRLSVGAEVVHRTADADDSRSYAALNFGGALRVAGPFSLLVSAGPGVLHRRDGGKFNAYVALATIF